MLDGKGRVIDYLRISVTDRCDLRCVYCMPEEGVCQLPHEDVLRYEEILRLAGIFASVGIKKIRLTGGEPLVRRDLPELVRGLKAVPGIGTVVMTTNGMLLPEQLPALLDAGLDGVNISIDAMDEAVFHEITRRRGVDRVLKAIDLACAAPGLRVKLNCVPTEANASQLVPLARLAGRKDISLRFIELMPIGEGINLRGLSEEAVKEALEAELGPLKPIMSTDSREKCRYFALPGGGQVGFISAVSHKFCAWCDRIRLTADGFLKTCLQYELGVALKPLLGKNDEVVRRAIETAVRLKPAGHHFSQGPEAWDEKRIMSQIGG